MAKAQGKAAPRGRKATAASLDAESQHSSREAELRQAIAPRELEDEPWVNPASLDAPKPRPGMKQRWIRTSTFEKVDVTNVNRKMREGWSPRKSDTVPKNFHFPDSATGRFAGCIMVEGMLLCEMPVERVARRNAHYANETKKMTAAIDAQLAGANPRAQGGFGQFTKQAQSVPVREKRSVSVGADD